MLFIFCSLFMALNIFCASFLATKLYTSHSIDRANYVFLTAVSVLLFFVNLVWLPMILISDKI